MWAKINTNASHLACSFRKIPARSTRPNMKLDLLCHLLLLKRLLLIHLANVLLVLLMEQHLSELLLRADLLIHWRWWLCWKVRCWGVLSDSTRRLCTAYRELVRRVERLLRWRPQFLSTAKQHATAFLTFELRFVRLVGLRDLQSRLPLVSLWVEGILFD